MKFVALISGGKDSFYNIMQCMNNGHTLLALANLHPSDSSVNELDSFMFQTVGHDIIEYYRQCIDGEVPLYRRAISGSSSNVSLEYEVTSNDETEDLYELLKDIKRQHPDIEGVSCGAILSHYQRTRVENVCDRLKLTCLAYLWQSDQSELMLEMCQLGLEAILIKVAAIGLTEKHLGKLLLEMLPILIKLNAMYDVHICGEGGEFESLVLDTPFFVKKLRVKHLKIILHSLDASYLSLEVEVVEKEKNDQTASLSCPSLFLENFEALGSGLSEMPNYVANSSNHQGAHFNIRKSRCHTRQTLYLGNLTSTLPSIEEQTGEILTHIKKYLFKDDCLLSRIQHMTVLVRNMADFSKINAVYETFFRGIFLPPSRVCVETTLPAPYLLQISCMVMQEPSVKSGIHIRSRSYWAPQNIGPYSQAIVGTRETFKIATLSGQIPLIPCDMVINHSMQSSMQSIISLQHLYKVKALINVGKIANIICYITEEIPPALVAEIWKRYISEIEISQCFLDHLLILQVTALPRGAIVEWGGLTFERTFDMYAEDSDDELTSVSNTRENITGRFDVVSVPLGDELFTKFTGQDINDLREFLSDPLVKNTFVNVFSDLDTIHRLSNLGFDAEWTPVVTVFDNNGLRCNYGVIWIS
ncbi:hypothetical protein METBIDRAFT_32522 [Metschnikowia bicuspidata var. bicuspidata NRRL YB-4993]|uniref:Diphthine--ammonia ligase n=1 Tax=Metschnikowia bicuspidata var. bicuspidata NRRL YB-4993 TaxID=869754 RepID=A0A1A0H9I0_9ASCO|nr:hypothetical protein METBIDRAFT_32522 [Metschnikowia bicuspidata var. bicuspidata NRRL YB-4993]OBA20533.1 hypothetical protein METBIDRAFT_32522 [Metschnikowia bicuspidata var. bicuspidata NRRL YB-4993]